MATLLTSAGDAAAWNAFVSAAPHGTFLQSWQWGQLQGALGMPVWRLAAPAAAGSGWDAVALVYRRALPLGKGWCYAPGGPVWSRAALTETARAEAAWTTMAESWATIARQTNSSFVRFDPLLPEGHPFFSSHVANRPDVKKADHDIQPRHTAVVDLTKPAAALLAAMHTKTRYNIRLAQRKGVQVRFSSRPADITLFLQTAADVHERSGFRYHPDLYYEKLSSILMPDGMAELAIAEHEGDVLAVYLLIQAGSVITYAHGASASRKRQLMAPYLLHWEAMQRAQDSGLTSYDLFGVAPADASPDHSWQGITRFKSGFNGEYRSFLGAHDLVVEPHWYAMATAARRWKNTFRT